MFLSKRSNGVYYLWFKDEIGKKHKVSTGCTLKAEALKFFQQFNRKSYQFKQESKNRLLSEFIQEFISYAEKNYAKGTVVIYSSTLRRFQSLICDCLLSSLTPRHVDLYRTERLSRELSTETVNIELRTLRAAMNVALRWKLIESNPFSKLQLAVYSGETGHPIRFKPAA